MVEWMNEKAKEKKEKRGKKEKTKEEEKVKQPKKPKLFVCRKHWPTEMQTYDCRGKNSPIDPPSLFPSKISSPPPTTLAFSKSAAPRPTKRALSAVRNRLPDELGSFLAQDNLTFDEIIEKTNSGAYMIETGLIVDTIHLSLIHI